MTLQICGQPRTRNSWHCSPSIIVCFLCFKVISAVEMRTSRSYQLQCTSKWSARYEQESRGRGHIVLAQEELVYKFIGRSPIPHKHAKLVTLLPMVSLAETESSPVLCVCVYSSLHLPWFARGWELHDTAKMESCLYLPFNMHAIFANQVLVPIFPLCYD